MTAAEARRRREVEGLWLRRVTLALLVGAIVGQGIINRNASADRTDIKHQADALTAELAVQKGITAKLKGVGEVGPCRAALESEREKLPAHPSKKQRKAALFRAVRYPECQQQSRLLILSFCDQYPSTACSEIGAAVVPEAAAAAPTAGPVTAPGRSSAPLALGHHRPPAMSTPPITSTPPPASAPASPSGGGGSSAPSDLNGLIQQAQHSVCELLNQPMLCPAAKAILLAPLALRGLEL